MKRFGKVLGLAVLTAMTAVFMGCPTPGGGGDDDDDLITGAVYSGDEITFTVTEADSVNETETMLIIKYDRQNKDQLKGMTLSNVDLAVTIDGKEVDTKDSLKFELDPYSHFDNDEEKNADNTYVRPKEYKYKLPIGKKLVKGNVVKVKLNSATVTNAEADFSEDDDIPTIVISLIDTAEKAGYYTELCPNDKEYQTLITKKDGEKFPADDIPVEPVPDDRPKVGDVVYEATGDDLKITLGLNKYKKEDNDTDDTIQGLQFADEDGLKYLPKGAKADEEYTIVMKGTASAEVTANVQFLKEDWSGLGTEGSDISTEFTTTEFSISNAFTFNSDSTGKFKFAIGNEDRNVKDSITLTLTEFTITRTK